MISLISSGAAGFLSKDFIPYDEVRARYPIVFSDRRKPELSDSYEFVRTSDIVDHFVKDAGYAVVGVLHGRKGSVSQYGMHSVRVRPPDGSGIRRIGELMPEVVITNSYDGTSSAQLDMGLFRFLCANGLVLGTSCGMSFRMQHRGSIREQIETAIQSMLAYVPQVNEVVERWSDRRLTTGEKSEFNARVKVLRGIDQEVDFLRVRRSDDEVDTLWGAYNVAQENLLRGDTGYVSRTGRRASLRPLRAVNRSLSLNKKLWDVASEFLPA
jgi:hypothetical protein